MKSLELINVNLSFNIFIKLTSQPYKYFSKRKISIPKLKMINVKFDDELEFFKEPLINKFKHFNFLEISGIYRNKNPILFNNKDLKLLKSNNKHFNMKINSNHISEDINPTLLKNITLI